MPEITKDWNSFMVAATGSDKFKMWSKETGKDEVRFVVSTSQFAYLGKSSKREYEEKREWCKTIGLIVELADEPYIDVQRLYIG